MAITTWSLRVTTETPAEQRKADRAVQALVGTSRSETAGLFDHGCVSLNGRSCTSPWQRLEVGDALEVRHDLAHRLRPRKKAPAPAAFGLLHDDADVVVVLKPADCLTVPSPRRESDTLIQLVAAHLTRPGSRRPVRLRAVQRLDRGVSGVLVFAKSSRAFEGLRRQFAAHEPEREYVALVAGRVTPEEGTFRSRLVTSRSLSRHSTADPEAGESAVTHWRVERHLDDATLVRVRLETGRRHQIRVHFAEAGHPVLGDDRHATDRAKHARWRARRLALHAATLSFRHPGTGARLRFEAPLPGEFVSFLA